MLKTSVAHHLSVITDRLSCSSVSPNSDAALKSHDRWKRRLRMPTKIVNQSEPRPDARLPASSEPFHPSLDGHPAQSADDLKKVESDISRILIVDDNLEILKLVARMAEHLG